MTYPRIWQTVFFAISVMITILATLLIQPTLATQLLLLVPTIAILGLPHGALDMPIAQTLWPLNGWRGKARFGLLYIGLTMAVIAIWTLLPGPALFAFLLYSAFHFSGDWDDATPQLRVTGGVATIGAPALFWQAQVSDLLLGGQHWSSTSRLWLCNQHQERGPRWSKPSSGSQQHAFHPLSILSYTFAPYIPYAI